MKKNNFLLLSILFVFFYQFSCAQTAYQAEDANVIYKGVIETEHAGHTGTGYVNFETVSGVYLEWAVTMASAGDQTLTFFYALGKEENRPMMLTINGTDIQSFDFNGTGAWTTFISTSINTNLQEGLNVIRITSEGTDGPNMDKVEITGESSNEKYYTINLNQQGEGTLNANPDQDYYEYGSEVTLTATSVDTTFFVGWYGNKNSEDSIITITIDTINYLTAGFMRYNVLVKTNKKVGWVDYESATTGGEGGEVVTVSNQADLVSAVSGTTARIVQVEGTIELTPLGTEIDVSSNKTIKGIGESSEIVGGGFRVIDATNVIIKDLTFRDAFVDWDGKTTDNDALEINNSTHVWITHCNLSRYDDGLIDIKNGSDYVTVSWCHFHNHNKVLLIGSADDSPQDVDHLNVTVHHNWFDGRFDNGLWRRLPLCRYGKIHVFNNYYCEIDNSGVEGNWDSDVVIDNNYFYKSLQPHALVSGAGGAGDNKMEASGNIYIESGARRDVGGSVFSPTEYYSYEYNLASDVPVIVMQGAGVMKDTLIGKNKNDDTDTTGAISSINIADQNLFDLKVYPNPATEELFLEYELQNESTASLFINDLSGRKIMSWNLNELRKGKNNINVNISMLKPGHYIISYHSNNNIISKYLIVH